MRRMALGSLMLIFILAGCEEDVIFVDDDVPAEPRSLDASYYAGAVTVTWELHLDWLDEPFRVYSRPLTDADFLFIAEVTSCIQGFCSYVDTNIIEGETYQYIVSAVSPSSGNETDSPYFVEVAVPLMVPPPVPDAPLVIALDDANFFTWGTGSRVADFSHYKVYQDQAGTELLLGETDSEGFLDLLASNGSTFSYFVTAVDTDGHESLGSVLASGTPRPDFHGEVVFDHADQPGSSGFRFEEDEQTFPVLSGTDAARHFRLESDINGWWLVPNGANATVYPTGFVTTSLKCGVASDAACVDVPVAPTSGYLAQDVQLFSQESYVMRVVGNDNQMHYGVVRIDLLGFDQNGDGIMIFDWAYQLQAGNPDLTAPIGG